MTADKIIGAIGSLFSHLFLNRKFFRRIKKEITKHIITTAIASKKPKTNPNTINNLKSPAPVILHRKIYITNPITTKNENPKIELNNSFANIVFFKKNDKNKYPPFISNMITNKLFGIRRSLKS